MKNMNSYTEDEPIEEPIISFNKISKSFGSRQVLRGISFTVSKGKIVAILGTSGTGKTVLLKTLVGLMSIDSGSIHVFGKKINGYSEEQFLAIRKQCGMVFQGPALIDSLSVFDNIAIGLRHHLQLNHGQIVKHIDEAIKLVQLDANILSLMPSSLSFGMQKRVSLARTIVMKPKIMLFDEPTTGLDPVARNNINRLIANLALELRTTTLVVSHDIEGALAIADHIIFLDNGLIIDQGNAQDIQKSPHPLVQAFLNQAII